MKNQNNELKKEVVDIRKKLNKIMIRLEMKESILEKISHGIFIFLGAFFPLTFLVIFITGLGRDYFMPFWWAGIGLFFIDFILYSIIQIRSLYWQNQK